MKRRLFLRGLTVAGGATAAGCGASTLSPSSLAPSSLAPSPQDALDPAELRDVLRRLDRALAAAVEIDSLAVRLAPPELPCTPERLRAIERTDPLLRRAVRTMIVMGARTELPHRVPPPAPFLERVAEEVPEMDRSVAETIALFEGMSPRAKRRLGRSLRSKPGFTMDLFGRLDPIARHGGVAESALWKMRRAAREVGFRMEKQSAAGFLDEQSSQVRRIAARHGLGAVFARQLATAAATHLLFDLLDSPGGEADGPGGVGRPSIPEMQEVRVLNPGDPQIYYGVGLILVGSIAAVLGAIPAAFTLGISTVATTIGLGVLIGGIVTLIEGQRLNDEAAEDG